MKINDYEKEIDLKCPICGNDKFTPLNSSIDDDIVNQAKQNSVQCTDCHRIFEVEELLEENRQQIYDGLEQLGDDLVELLENEVKKLFNKK